MLVLSRKMEESIMIGSKIEVTVLSVANGRVKLGIRARGMYEFYAVNCRTNARPRCKIVALMQSARAPPCG